MSDRTKLPLFIRIDALSAYLSMRQLTALEAEEAVTTLFDARAEVFRLRDALRQITEVATDLPHARRRDRDEMRRLAREALDG